MGTARKGGDEPSDDSLEMESFSGSSPPLGFLGSAD